jgi:diamine N-acetyltransferase
MHNLLKGEKIYLRALEPDDVNILYKWENETSVWHLSNTLSPFSKYVLEQYVQNSHLDIYTTKQLRLIVCDKTEKAIGCIDLFDFDPKNLRAGIGILIAEEPEKQKGYATEALQLLINYSFDVLNLHQLYCNINTDNTISLSLFQKQGFIVTGTKKEWNKTALGWKDECFLQLLKND